MRDIWAAWDLYFNNYNPNFGIVTSVYCYYNYSNSYVGNRSILSTTNSWAFQTGPNSIRLNS